MDDPIRVLAVDDSVTIRKALELILAPAGYDVAFAASGGEALAQVAQRRPALVLLDFILPDMRGSDVCRVLREDPATAALPVVLISARGAEIQQAYQDAPNVVRYLPKPFTPEEVLAIVAELTASRPAAVEREAASQAEAAGAAPVIASERAAALPAEPPAVVADILAPAPPMASLAVEAADPEDDEADLAVAAAAPRSRETLEAMFETLRAGLEGVFVEEVDTPAGAAADQAKSYTELASRLSAQLADALRQAESGGRYALCGDGSVRSLADTLLDSYRRVCRLLFRAAAAGAAEAERADTRPRLLVVSRPDSALAALLESVAGGEDWAVLRVCSDFRQLPVTVRLYGPTHLLVETAAGGSAVWDQMRLVRAMPEARRMEVIGVRTAGEDAAVPVDLLRAAGVGDVLEAGAGLPVALRDWLTPVAAAA